MKFYIYYKPKWGLKVLKDRKIHVTNPAESNDPYEFAPYIYFLEKDDNRPKSRPEMISNLKIIISEALRLICGSGINDEILMWSYYAQKHEGIVIEYDLLMEPFKSIPDKISVSYNSIREKFIITKGMEMRSFEEQLLKLVSKKALNWNHEKEYRLLLTKNLFTDDGYFDITPECIKSVTFGFNCKKSTLIEVGDICDSERYSHIRYYGVRLHAEQYKLEIKEASIDELIRDVNGGEHDDSDQFNYRVLKTQKKAILVTAIILFFLLSSVYFFLS